MSLHWPLPGILWTGASGLLVILGWVKGINLLILFGDLLLALVIVNIGFAYGQIRGVSAKRRLMRIGFAREPLPHHVEVRNAGSGRASIMVVDGTPGTPGAAARWWLETLPADAAVTLRTEWMAPSRGRYAVGPLRVESEYPLGLARWSKQVEGPTECLILPAIGTVDLERFRQWLARSAGGDARTRRMARRPHPGRGDIRGTRPFRPGDGPRDIHWRTTARRGQLVVREYDQSEASHRVLILDPWQPDTSETATERLNWALELMTSVAWAWAMSSEPLDLTIIVPGQPPVRGRATRHFVLSALTPLADLAGQPVVPAVSLPGPAYRTACVVVSTRPNGPLLAELRRTGIAAAGVDPSATLPWYRPPAIRATVSGRPVTVSTIDDRSSDGSVSREDHPA